MNLNYDIESPDEKNSVREELRTLIRQFIDSDKNVAEIVDDQKYYKSVTGLYSAVKQIVRRHFYKEIRVHTKNGSVYITKFVKQAS